MSPILWLTALIIMIGFKKMRKLTKTYLLILSLLTILSVLSMRYVWSEHHPDFLYLIPIFFLVMLGIMYLLKRGNDRKGKDPTVFFLPYRLVKIMLSLIFLLVYFMTVRSHLLPFAVLFMIFYIGLSSVETIHFMKREKN